MNNRSSGQPTWLRLGLIALLLLAFALRLLFLSQQDIWWDEARNLDVAMRPLTQIAVAPELDIQPPVYYYMLHGWLGANGVEMGDTPTTMAWLARFLSVLCGVVLVGLAGALARRIGGHFAALAAVAIAAVSPFWLAESQETRMYTLALALLSAAAWALLEAIARRERTSRRTGGQMALWVAFVLTSAAALLVHYNAVFVLVAWYAWWLIQALARRGGWGARWQAFKPLLFCGLATSLIMIPIVPVALRQIPDYANANLVVPSTWDYLLQNVRGHLAGYTWEASALWGNADAWVIAVVAIVVIGLALLAARRRGRAGFLREFGFLGVWLLGALILYYIAVLDRGAFNIRYSAFVTPALFALAGAGVAGWQRWRRLPLGVVALAIIVLGMLPFVRADLTDARFFREDISGVTEWLRQNTHSGDVILVDQKYPFAFYYDRYVIDAQAEPQGMEVAPARYLFVDINTLASQLSDWAADADRVFWVQWFESDTDPRHAVPFLLDQNGQHDGEKWFQGWSIDWWQMQPPNQFVLDEGMTPLQISFAGADGGARLETVEASLPQALGNGEPVPVVLRWQRGDGNGLERAVKARVALYDNAGNRVAQADERVLNDRHLAPSQWTGDDMPLNVYLLQPENPLQSGNYQLRLLVYDAETLEPLTLLDATGTPAGQEATLGEVTVE